MNELNLTKEEVFQYEKILNRILPEKFDWFKKITIIEIEILIEDKKIRYFGPKGEVYLDSDWFVPKSIKNYNTILPKETEHIVLSNLIRNKTRDELISIFTEIFLAMTATEIEYVSFAFLNVIFIDESKIVSESYSGKFSFKVNNIYEFEDLPSQIQKDIEIQFENSYDEGPYDYIYKYTLLSPEEIESYLFSVFGEDSLQDAIDEPYMKKLIDNIKTKGLKYPAVGSEGNHRALAHYFLGMPLPYLEMIPKEIND